MFELYCTHILSFIKKLLDKGNVIMELFQVHNELFIARVIKCTCNENNKQQVQTYIYLCITHVPHSLIIQPSER